MKQYTDDTMAMSGSKISIHRMLTVYERQEPCRQSNMCASEMAAGT